MSRVKLSRRLVSTLLHNPYFLSKASFITGYRKVLSLLSSTDSNATTTTTPAAGSRTPGDPKATTDLRDSPVSGFKELKAEVQAIINQMNSGMVGSQSFSWRVCGLYKSPHTAGNHSNLMTESKTHDLRSTLTEPIHPAHPAVPIPIPTASAPYSSSLRLHSSTQNNSTSSSSLWSSVLHYFSSYTTPLSPAMERTLETTVSDSITRSGSAVSDSVPGSGSEQGYTCGLWLLLHYVTGADYAYSYVLHPILSCSI